MSFGCQQETFHFPKIFKTFWATVDCFMGCILICCSLSVLLLDCMLLFLLLTSLTFKLHLLPWKHLCVEGQVQIHRVIIRNWIACGILAKKVGDCATVTTRYFSWLRSSIWDCNSPTADPAIRPREQKSQRREELRTGGVPCSPHLSAASQHTTCPSTHFTLSSNILACQKWTPVILAKATAHHSIQHCYHPPKTLRGWRESWRLLDPGQGDHMASLFRTCPLSSLES